MLSRRSLLRSTLLAAGTAGAQGLLPGAVQKAFAIAPDPGTTYLNAEHVVILMQENRSFDHMFGTLRGVRGFNDRRTPRQADGASIFLQRNARGQACLPWHASLKESKITWMGDTPHARSDHLDAWNGGTCGNWLTAKTNRRFPDIPVTMAYHTREDLPFYYALADAFTVCDQNFSGALTETAPNRLFLWSGTVREPHETGALAYLKNGQTHPGALAWTSFPERLERAGVSWKFYQNDSWCESPLGSAEAAWLGNDGDNTLERFARVKPRFSPAYRAYTHGLLDDWIARVEGRRAELARRLAGLDAASMEADSLRRWLGAYDAQKARLAAKREHGNADFSELTPEQQSIHAKVMTTNAGDPDFRTLTTLTVDVGGREEEIAVPKGDVLHQFRQDVRAGRLPAVSWLVGAANFSAHPGAPFYGAWYVSEILSILTENPLVWKKTIFILTFDENDGFFDHVPPFVACDPRRPETGKVSQGLDPAPEYAYAEDERIQGTREEDVRDGPIGLGYRVPMIIASPWTRGGWVNSQVFEHSSIIRFLETFVAARYGKDVRQSEISAWRRAISGNLTSCFRPAADGEEDLPFLDRAEHLAAIARARFKPLPEGFAFLERSAYDRPDRQARVLDQWLWQEEGSKPSCALPYELTVQGRLDSRDAFEIEMSARRGLFGKDAAGAPFTLYLHGVREGSAPHDIPGVPNSVATAHYAVRAGDTLRDRIALSRFATDVYDIEVHGPNGFFRQFRGKGAARCPLIACTPRVSAKGARQAGLLFALSNPQAQEMQVVITSNAYVSFHQTVDLPAHGSAAVLVPTDEDHSWYDVSVTLAGLPDFLQRYAGRVETGASSISDPLMGRAR